MVLIAEHARMIIERRDQSRSNLRVPLLLLAHGWPVPLRTETDNVSMDGFFCHTQEVFAPGDRLRFLLLLPAPARDSEPAKATCLQGTAEVVRVVACASGTDFGIGCRLSNYRVVTNIDLASEEMLAILSQAGRFEAWLACD